MYEGNLAVYASSTRPAHRQRGLRAPTALSHSLSPSILSPSPLWIAVVRFLSKLVYLNIRFSPAITPSATRSMPWPARDDLPSIAAAPATRRSMARPPAALPLLCLPVLLSSSFVCVCAELPLAPPRVVRAGGHHGLGPPLPGAPPLHRQLRHPPHRHLVPRTRTHTRTQNPRKRTRSHPSEFNYRARVAQSDHTASPTSTRMSCYGIGSSHILISISSPLAP
jgi:hypothetical protein